jgi:hypothetical protein
MKCFIKNKIFLAIMLSFWATSHLAVGQTTNTFPSTGNAGIGTTTPFLPLHIQGTQSDALLPLLLLRNSSGTASSAVSLDFTNFGGTQSSTQIGARIQALRTTADARHTLVFSTANGSWVLSEQMRLTDTGNLGIGTSTPQGKLDVSGQFYTSIGNSIVLRAQNGTNEGGQLRFDGAGTNRYFYFDNLAGDLRFISQNASDESEKIRILNNGSVGIGTVNPTSKLHVSGSALFETGEFLIQKTGGAELNLLNLSSNKKWQVVSGFASGLEIGNVTDNLIDANAPFYISASGQVGIGTTSPNSNYKLSVNGKIRAHEVVVETGWSDFVFADDYRLKPLNEVEQYVKTNKHLPGIPSEKDVAANGVSLGEMQSKLLQKVEELTLYVIGLNQKTNQLQSENQRLKQRIALLEKNNPD